MVIDRFNLNDNLDSAVHHNCAMTPKQERFCQEIASGKSQAEAYRAAFDAENMKPATIHKRASELMDNGEVTGRVDELRAELAKKAMWTREMSVKALIRVFAAGDTPAAVKVSAVKELNAMHGYNAPTELNVTTRELPASVDDFV